MALHESEELKIEILRTDAITPYKFNAKKHPKEQVEQIKKSIQEFGFNDPIAVWGEDNLIVEGHGRLLAAKELGLSEVPVIRLDRLSDEQRRAYTLAHNQLTMNSDFDLEALAVELSSIQEIDMSDFGFDLEEEKSSSGEENLEKDEDPYADIEKMEKHYGVPYQGNKSRIADIIISILPAGKRLVDLFGGGCDHTLRHAEREMAVLSLQRHQQNDHRAIHGRHSWNLS